MSGIFQVKELDARKRALAAQSEVYRQTLVMEARNLMLYGTYLRRRYTRPNPSNVLLLLAPVLGGLWMTRARKKRSMFSRVTGSALLGWKIYQKVAPYCGGFFSRFASRRYQARAEAKAPAANV
jgi:hypothetical protein